MSIAKRKRPDAKSSAASLSAAGPPRLEASGRAVTSPPLHRMVGKLRFARPAVSPLYLLLFLLHKLAVGVARTKIDVDAFDPVALEYEELRVAERLTFLHRAAIGHKGRVTLLEDALDLVRHPAGGAERPAALEILCLADAIVVGAGEGEVLREDLFQRIAIAVLVRRKAIADEVGFGRHAYAAAASFGKNLKYGSASFSARA